MSNDPNKQQQEGKASGWATTWFGSSTKAPRSAKRPPGTNPTTHATPTQLPRFVLSTPSSSAAPTTNGFPSAFTVDRSSSGMQADVSAPATDSKPPAAATPFGTRAMAGGYSTKTPSALKATPGSNTGMSQLMESSKSTWKYQSGVINGVDSRGLSGANSGTLAEEIRRQQSVPFSTHRQYNSRSALIVQRGLTRAGSKRSQQDPELIRRVLREDWSQQSLKRVFDGSAPSRNNHGFDRFLPQRALGANQSGARVPVTDSHMEDEEDEGDGPPNKKARKVTFEQHGGRTYSEPTWNARKTPVRKSKRKSERSTSLEPHGDDDVASDCSWNRFPSCPYLPPFDFSPGGDHIRHYGRKVNPSFRLTHAGKRRKAGTNLSSFESELQDANFDEALLLQQRAELTARIEEKAKSKIVFTTDDVGEPWICSSCQNSNNHEETYCQKCSKARSDGSKASGWGSNMFPGKTFGFWKCSSCSIATNPPTATVCPSCLVPRPNTTGATSAAAAAAAPAASTGTMLFPSQIFNSTPGSTKEFSFGISSSTAGSTKDFSFGISASSAGDSVSGKQNTPAGEVGGFLFGIKANAGTSDAEPSKASSQPFSGAFSAGKVPEKPLFGIAAPSSVNQEPTTSSTGGFSFGITPPTNAAAPGGFSFGTATATTESSLGDKESKESNSSNQVNSVALFGPQSLSQPQPKADEQTEVEKSAGEPFALGSATSSGLNASAPPFAFGRATAAPSGKPMFAFGAPAATTTSSTESLFRSAPNELDETSRGDERSTKRRSLEEREGGDSGGTTPFPTSTTPAFAPLFGRSTSPTPPSSQTAAEAGNGVAAASALFGTPAAPKAPFGEATLLPSSSTPAFGAFGSSSNNTGPSGVSAATEGFALSSSTAPAPPEQSGSAAAAPAPGITPPFLFGSTTPAPAPAFQFGSTPAPAASSTPAPAAMAFGNLGGANPFAASTPAPAPPVFGNLGAANPLGSSATPGSSTFNFGTASAAPAVNFGGGSSSTPSNPPTTFGFGGTPAPPVFGNDPFASQGSTISSAGFTPVQPFGMPPTASTPGAMTFGAPAATPVGNGFGSAPLFNASTPVNPGFGAGFATGALGGMQDVNFSIGSAGPKSAKGGRRILKAKRPR